MKDSKQPTPVIGRRSFLAGGMAVLLGCSDPGSTESSPSVAPSSGSAGSSSSLAPTSSAVGTSAVGSSSTSSQVVTPPPVLDDLAAGLRGVLLRPGDQAYDPARLLFDPEFDGVMPAAVAQVADASDVQRCVAFAAEAGMPITARSGGHSYIGSSTVADGLVVDLRGLSSVDMIGGDRANVGSGAQLIDVYAGLAAEGRAIPAGTCPAVGVAGLTLGGGVGVTGRAWGLTCDNLAAADVVVADGRIVTASPSENPDLFWALQGGGGGTAGIVTRFEFATRPALPIATFFLRWDAAAAADVIPAWLAWAPNGPDELWSNCQYGVSGDRTLTMVGAWLGGDEAALNASLDQLEAATGTRPGTRSVRVRPFLDAMLFMAGCSERTVAECHLPSDATPAGELPRVPFAAKSAYLASVPDDAGMAAMVAVLDRAEAPDGAGNITMIIDSNGGAIGRVPADATAFPHRSSIASIQYYGGWTSAAAAAPTRQWLNEGHARLAPWTTGGAYVNYLDPDLVDTDSAYFGSNAGRLAGVKQQWDPDRLFDVGQIIGRT